MPRKQLIESSKLPYHIVNRSNNRDFFYLPQEDLWEIFLHNLKRIQQDFGCIIHAFVLMSNHYHLVLSTPDLQLSEAMTCFHREVARQSNKISHRMNHFFGGRYKWCLIHDELYYWNAIKYLFRNPIEANLCQKVEEYQYSSFTVRDHQELFFMTDFFRNPEVRIQLDADWLNAPFIDSHRLGIQRALRRKEFKLPLDENRNAVSLSAMIVKNFQLK